MTVAGGELRKMTCKEFIQISYPIHFTPHSPTLPREKLLREGNYQRGGLSRVLIVFSKLILLLKTNISLCGLSLGLPAVKQRRICGVLCPKQLTSSFDAVKRVEQSFYTEDERMKVQRVHSMYFKAVFSALLLSGSLVLGKVFL